MDSIELKGLTFRVEVKPDDGTIGAPWDEHDGHGPVRDVQYCNGDPSTIRKPPGERVLYADRGTVWLYDWQEACRIAKRDGWGLAPDDIGRLKVRLGREPQPGDIRAEAVQRDFDYCRRYASGDWYWCGIVVTLLDVDGEPTRECESLWGMESDALTYLDDTASELASEIARRVGRRKTVETGAVRVRVRK